MINLYQLPHLIFRNHPQGWWDNRQVADSLGLLANFVWAVHDGLLDD